MVELYSVFNLGTRLRRVVNARPRPLYFRERDSPPVVQEAGWAPAPVWAGAEDLARTGTQSGPYSP